MIFTGDIAQPYTGASEYEIPNALRQRFWFGNLEGSLLSDTVPQGVYNAYEAIGALSQNLSFKAFTIANNHLLDSATVDTTLQNMRNIGVPVVGGGILSHARQPIIVEDSNGDKYRILAFGWENIQCIPATESKEGVNPYTLKNVLGCVNEALQHEESVICFMHWDYELEKYPLPYDRHLAHELIDMGVAAVIGCHAHRTQPIEFYKGKPIVYGLGNFLFCQGHYFGGKLCFPKFCAEEYAFEISKDGYVLHFFNYDQEENRLNYVKSEEISAEKAFDGKAEFTGFSDSQYEQWFKKHRVQKKLLPVFYAKESNLGYWLKSKWIKIRGSLINLLTKMNLKSANRANR